MMGNLVVKLGLDSKGFTRGLDTSKKKLGTFTKSVVSSAIKVGAVLGTAVAAGVSSAVFKFAAYGDSLDKMSKRTGFATNTLSELGFAAEQSGTDLGTLEKGIIGMDRFLLNSERGLSTATDSLRDLGLTFSDLDGLSPEKQFSLLASRIADIEDPSKKAALAMSIFGKAGQKMVPLLSEGSAAIEDLRKQARDLGVSMSSKDAAAAAEFTDSWNSLKKVVMGVVYVVGSKAIPLFTDGVNLAITFGKEWKGAFESVIPSFKAMGTLFAGAMLGIVKSVNMVTHFFVAVMPAVLTGFSHNWNNTFKTAADYVETVFTNLGANIKSAMGEIWDFIASGGRDKLAIAWTPLAEGFKSSIKDFDIPERVKTKFEIALEDQLKGNKKSAGKKTKDNLGAVASGVDLNISEKSEKPKVGAALRGSRDAISTILRNVNASGKAKVEEMQLKAMEKMGKHLEKSEKSLSKINKAFTQKNVVLSAKRI